MEQDQNKIISQMMEFNKTIFDNTFKTISTIQNQSERVLTSFMQKATWLPGDGKKAIIDWISICEKGRDDFKKAADDKYEKAANLFLRKENVKPQK